MQYNGSMKRAPRYPSRWAGWMRTLGTTAALSVALGACSNVFGPKGGTMEYPGSGAGPNAVAVYVVNEKDTVDSISQRYGVPSQTIIDRNKLKAPYTLKAGQYIELPGARFVADNTGGATQAAATTAPGPVKRDNLPPPPGAKSDSAEPKTAAAGQPTPLSPAAAEASKTEASVAATRSQIVDRDKADSAVSEFSVAADGVIVVDTSHVDFEGSVAAVLQVVRAAQA